MKLFITAVVTLLLVGVLAGCSVKQPVNIEDDISTSFDIDKADALSDAQADASVQSPALSIEDKFNAISFYPVSNHYCKSVIVNDVEYTEMFLQEKNTFVRASKENEMDQEIFSYDYVTTDFTYLYYFENELLLQVIVNLETGALLEGDQELAELLTPEAKEIQSYFNELLSLSGLTLEDL